MDNDIRNWRIEKLAADRQHVLAELTFLQNQLKFENSPDIADIAAELAHQEVVSTLIRNQKQKLEEIEVALQQLRKGTYGICVGCQQPIDPERLAILPEAKYCLSCKMKSE